MARLYNRRWLAVVIFSALGLLLLGRSPAPADTGSKNPSSNAAVRKAAKAVDMKRMRKNLFYFASDAMEGREAGSRGGHEAARFLAEAYEGFGLEPAGSVGFFQPWGAGQPAARSDFTHLRMQKSAREVEAFELGSDFETAVCSARAVVEGKVVFGGYGITAPEHGYDDYASLDVTDKLVLVLDHEPQCQDENSPFDGKKLTAHATLAAKAENAAAHGAVGLLVVRDRVAHPEEKGLPQDGRVGAPSGEPSRIPVAYLSEDLADQIAKMGRKKLAKLQQDIDAGLKPLSSSLRSKTFTLRVPPANMPGMGRKNVIALKRGVDPKLRDEYIVISAHYDHVGRGNSRNSRGGVGQIHNGADDNASGTCALVELARTFQKLQFRRSILLMSFDAEEEGLLGSKHFVSNPTVPLEQIVTILNVDMVSRNKPAEIYVGGLGRNAGLDEIVQRVTKRYKFEMNPQGMERYIKRSDQWPFMERGVPGLFFYGGEHEDYHKATDDPEKCNVLKMKVFTQIVLVVLWELGNVDESPRRD